MNNVTIKSITMSRIKKLFRNRYSLFIASLFGFFASLLYLNPINQSFIVILIPLFFFWIVIFSLSIIILKQLPLPGSRQVVFPFILATSCTMLVMFSAIDTVSWADVLLIVSLTMVGTFYFNRTWPK